MPNIKVSPPSASSRVSVKPNEANKKDVNNEKLMVALRVRPLRHEERKKGIQCVAEAVDNNMVILSDPGGGKGGDHLRKKRNNDRQYVFDVAFGADSSQQEVYEKTTKPLIDSVLEGYNATVFAYGATGSGKTYTMVGTPDNPGCMVRALNDLFEAMDTNTDSIFKITMSYLEIYNENIRDLLNPGSGHLDLRDDSKGKNIQVAGLSEVTTTSTEEVMRILQRGNKERTTEATQANKTSSRSHALLIVNVKQTAKSRAQTKGAVKSGRLYMIDLAGSERAAVTQNSGIRLKEGAHINRSLLALGNVINALAENKTKHVNFRDSKLTRLLKDPLSGNCHTVMIAQISPSDKSRDESRNTLVYADRAKNISNKVRKNVLDVQYHVSQYQSIISELKGEIARLKDKMQFDSSSGKNVPASGNKKIQEELKELRDAFVINFNEQMKLRHRLMEIDNHLLSLSMEFEKQNIIITEWETEKAKRRHDRKRSNVKRGKNKKKPDDEEDAYKGDNEESGFEDNGSATADDDVDDVDRDNVVKSDENVENVENVESVENDENIDKTSENDAEDDNAEKTSENDAEDTKNEDDNVNNDVEEAKQEDETDETDDEGDFRAYLEDEPEEVRNAWEELMMIQREQQRYSDIRMDQQHDLEKLRKEQKKLEDELPKRISTTEEAEILQLLCRTHELEIAKVEMQSDALLQQHEVRRRDLLLLKYDRQRNLMNEIIERQKALIEANKNGGKTEEGVMLTMPPELMELYMLYQQELDTRTENDNLIINNANSIMRAPSVLSLRGPEFDDKPSDRLPPIRQESASGQLFQSRNHSSEEDLFDRPYTPSAMTSSQLETNIPALPPIEKRRSLRRSHSLVGSRFDRSSDAKPEPEKTRIQNRKGKSIFGGGQRKVNQKRDVIERRTIDTRFPSAPESGTKGSSGSTGIKARAAARAGSRRRSVDENAAKQLKDASKQQPKRKYIDPFENIGFHMERF